MPRTLRTTVTAVGALALGALCGTAGAATPAVPAPFTAAQAGQARTVVTAPATTDLLTRFFAADAARRHLRVPAAAGAAAPRTTGPTVTVYTLGPGFVAGRPGAPVADPDFLATEAVAPDGRTASVWTARTTTGWRVVNVATGADETDYTARAHGDGTVFREPQIHAWYVLRAGRVLPLNAEARAAVGPSGRPLADYQRLVHREYGDKLPGSAYDRAGLAGGFDARTSPVPRSASVASAASAPSAPASGFPAAPVAASLGVAGLGVWRWRRRANG
ncbi:MULTISPECIES: hypothetical protein [Streptomycetaceae]|nr:MULTISPECIES: hypothetical protein [Streptomycetaceae]